MIEIITFSDFVEWAVDFDAAWFFYLQSLNDDFWNEN